MPDPIVHLNAALEDRYRIERELGEGGMATVYLADDLRHERKVALKVLKPELAAVVGAERFLAEVKTTANLQHPHILPLHDSGEADGFLFYVMPYVEEESLRRKLDREHQLPVDEAIAITSKVAAALDYAHRHGVIHRDIKPANILLQDGEPVVADFGIALVVTAAGGDRLTETGLSLGTPHYMSPEQATAEEDITNRSDIYSLASVLYEMLAGDPPHTGSTAQQVIAMIVGREPAPITESRKSVPPNVAAAVRKALEKVPADRFESAKAFAEALGDPAFTTTTTGIAPTAFTTHRRAATPILAATTMLFAALFVWVLSRPEPLEPVTRFSIPLPEESAGRVRGMSALAPDGSRFVTVRTDDDGSSELWVRDRDQLRATLIPGTAGAVFPFFSPDGSRVAFLDGRAGALRVVRVDNGAVNTLKDSLSIVGGSWGGDGYVYVGTAGGLVRIPVRGDGPLEQVTKRESSPSRDEWHILPSALPSGRGVVFTVSPRDVGSPFDPAANQIAVAAIGSGTYEVLTRGVAARFASTGHLLVVRDDGGVVAAPFDETRLVVTGEWVPLLDGVRVGRAGLVDLDISEDGTLMYVRGAQSAAAGRLARVDESGRATILPIDGGLFRGVRFSPEGRRIVYGRGGSVFVHDLAVGTTIRLASEMAAFDPLWSPDGDQILFHARTDSTLGWDTFEAPADGGGPVRQVFRLADVSAAQAWTSDGRLLARGPSHEGGEGSNLFIVTLSRDSAHAEPYLRANWDEHMPDLSPDGRWVAYVSNETGRSEVYVRPFPDPAGGQWRISEGGGAEPIWGHDGSILYYQAGRKLRMVRIRLSAGLEVTSQVDVPLDGEYLPPWCCYANYDAHPGGDGFVMVLRDDGSGDQGGDQPEEMVVVLNFFEELKAHVER